MSQLVLSPEQVDAIVLILRGVPGEFVVTESERADIRQMLRAWLDAEDIETLRFIGALRHSTVEEAANLANGILYRIEQRTGWKA